MDRLLRGFENYWKRGYVAGYFQDMHAYALKGETNFRPFTACVMASAAAFASLFFARCVENFVPLSFRWEVGVVLRGAPAIYFGSIIAQASYNCTLAAGGKPTSPSNAKDGITIE
ncbi:MAG: hypothetical protein KDK63_01735 [Chlamydiia bacterium]|nr:hypothetical protein [Chlamydiia bacterium]